MNGPVLSQAPLKARRYCSRGKDSLSTGPKPLRSFLEERRCLVVMLHIVLPLLLFRRWLLHTSQWRPAGSKEDRSLWGSPGCAEDGGLFFDLGLPRPGLILYSGQVQFARRLLLRPTSVKSINPRPCRRGRPTGPHPSLRSLYRHRGYRDRNKAQARHPRMMAFILRSGRSKTRCWAHRFVRK